jgi:hypothetical protein
MFVINERIGYTEIHRGDTETHRGSELKIENLKLKIIWTKTGLFK